MKTLALSLMLLGLPALAAESWWVASTRCAAGTFNPNGFFLVKGRPALTFTAGSFAGDKQIKYILAGGGELKFNDGLNREASLVVPVSGSFDSACVTSGSQPTTLQYLFKVSYW